jgi:2-isopropylmalate synthase
MTRQNVNQHHVKIFDTSLRDGEQAPGFSMNLEEKLQIARQLDRMGVDVIEAGFPIASPDDFAAVQKVAQICKQAEVAGLARALEKDILTCWDAVKLAKKPRIHTFVSTSPIHLKYQLNKTQDEVLQMAINSVKLAKSLSPRVTFSPMDATRTPIEYLLEVLLAAVEAGADTLNIPDTVGYSLPGEYGRLIKTIKEKVSEEIILSTHCHDDLGLAVANSMEGIENGAREVQCTINGIGERAGNASMEEIVMILKVRKDHFNLTSQINTKEIYPTSKLLTAITGIAAQPNKAIIGVNAFAHESGIHQDGVLKNPETYEIMKAEDIGIEKNRLILGKHSGRHALKDRLKSLGYDLKEEKLNTVFAKFKELADKKKQVYDEDLYLLVNESSGSQNFYQLVDMSITCGTMGTPYAAVTLQHQYDGEKTANAKGDGPVDAAYQAVNKIINLPNKLLEYSVNAVTQGIDAQATVSVKVEVGERLFSGSSNNTDITVASVEAYIEALNRALSFKQD